MAKNVNDIIKKLNAAQRKKVEARGWWDVTAMGWNSYCTPPHAPVVGVCQRIWPDGTWCKTTHAAVLGPTPGIESRYSCA